MTPSALDLLRELVAIPSVNPAFTGDDAVRGEGRLVDWLETWFLERGFRTRRLGETPGRPNLLACLGPEKASLDLLFESHLDTVGIQGFAGDPFTLREEGGRLYGRGACDTKGPLAAFLAALDNDTRADLESAGIQVAWLGAIGEETGNQGAEEAVAAGVRADQCVVLEPTNLRMVHAHKGACWFKVATRGRAGHGSDPARADNAILKMPAVWRAIEAATTEAATHHAHPALGLPTVSLGTIHGGSGINVVPDTCEIQVDRRFLPGESCEEILTDLRRRLADLPGGVQIALLKEGLPFHTEAEAELLRRLGEALADTGVPPERETAAWCSDAGVLSSVCGQTVVWGPGAIAQAHTAGEYIDVTSLQAGAETLCRFLRSYAAH